MYDEFSLFPYWSGTKADSLRFDALTVPGKFSWFFFLFLLGETLLFIRYTCQGTRVSLYREAISDFAALF